MPVYVVICKKGHQDRRLLPGPEALEGLTCRIVEAEGGSPCGIPVERRSENPTVHTKEVINLPHMLKPVERYTDAEKLYEERSKTDYRKPE